MRTRASRSTKKRCGRTGHGVLLQSGLALSFLCMTPGFAATLRLPTDAGAPPGESTLVPLLIDDASGVLGSFIDIRYDPSRATARNILKTSLTESHHLAFNLTPPGQIRISLSGVAPLSGGGVFLNIAFTSIGPLDSATALDLFFADLNEGAIPADLVDGSYCVQGEVGETTGLLITHPLPDIPVGFLSWAPDISATAYNIYRGELADLSDVTCFLSGVTGASTTVGFQPAATLEVYLISAGNCRGESTLGFASSGRERPALKCP